MDDVFIGSEALAAGLLTRGQLRWNYRTIFPDVYISKDAPPSLSHRIVGAWLWSRRRGVIAGSSAAALHGASLIGGSADVELIWRCGRPPRGIVTRNERIRSDEMTEVAGLPVTTPERTALDLAKHADRNAAVLGLDALARVTGVVAADVRPLVDRYRGAPELCRSIESLRLMDGGSHSPKETLTRLALIDAGLPTPQTQFTLTDGNTREIISMAYEAPRVGIKFGSGTTEFPAQMGWMMIHPTDTQNPLLTVYQVRAAVIERGYPLYRLQRISRT